MWNSIHFKDKIYNLTTNHSKIDFQECEQVSFSQVMLYRGKNENYLYPTSSSNPETTQHHLLQS